MEISEPSEILSPASERFPRPSLDRGSLASSLFHQAREGLLAAVNGRATKRIEHGEFGNF